VVHLGQHAGPFAMAGFAVELAIGQRRQVRVGERGKGEERFACLDLPLHERDRALRDLAVDLATLLEVVNLDVAAGLAPATLHDLRHRHDAW